MLSFNSPAFTALVILVLSLLRSPVAVECLHLTVPFWKMVVELVFYLVINKFPGYVVLAAFVAALALLVYTYRFTRVIALCLQGVSPFDEARYAAIDAYASSMYRPDVSGASWVARDVAAFPPLHGASAPAMLSSEACSSPSQLKGASEVISSSFSSPSVNGPGPLDRADHEYRPIVVGSVLVTNPNIISLESDTVLAGLSFDELCQLEADENAYYLSRNMEIASNCDSPSDVAALSVASVDGGVASGDAVVNNGCADLFSGALLGGVPAATAGTTGACFPSLVVASADLVSVDAGNSVVIGTKRSREDIGDGLGVGEASRKRSKRRFTTAVCGFCCASVLQTVARADVLSFGSCAVFSGLKRPRVDGGAACQEGKRFKAAFAGDALLVSGFSGVSSAVQVWSNSCSSSTAAIFAAAASGPTDSTIAPFTAGFTADASIATVNTALNIASNTENNYAAVAAATATAINDSTTASLALAAAASTMTAATARRIAVPRAFSRRHIASSSVAITSSSATATTRTTATTTSLASASSTNSTRKTDCENNKNKDNYDELEGFNISVEELDRLLDEIDQEFD